MDEQMHNDAKAAVRALKMIGIIPKNFPNTPDGNIAIENVVRKNGPTILTYLPKF